jgi:hypothetical protein
MDNYLSFILNKNPENKFFTGIVYDLDPLQVSIYPADNPINCKSTTNLIGLKVGSNVILMKIGNQFIITNVIGTPLGLYSCILTKDTQSISDGSLTAISFTSEEYDPMVMHDNSTNNSRITILKAGRYNINISGRFADSSTSGRILYLYKNNVAYNGYTAGHDGEGRFGGSYNVILNLSVNDYLEFFAYQHSGGSLDLTSIQFNVSPLIY